MNNHNFSWSELHDISRITEDGKPYGVVDEGYELRSENMIEYLKIKPSIQDSFESIVYVTYELLTCTRIDNKYAVDPTEKRNIIKVIGVFSVRSNRWNYFSNRRKSKRMSANKLSKNTSIITRDYSIERKARNQRLTALILLSPGQYLFKWFRKRPSST